MEQGKKQFDRSAPKVGTIVFDIQSMSQDVVELTWDGYMSEATIGDAPGRMSSFLGLARPTYAIFDATGVTSFSGDSRIPGGAILAELKRRGVKRTYVITDSGPIRMIGSAVAFAVGLQIRFLETRAEAERAIAKDRGGTP